MKAASLVWLVVAEAAAADLSFFDRTTLLDGALREQFGMDAQGCPRFYVQDVFQDYLIARSTQSEALYRIPYSLSGSTVTFGDASEVETAYVPVAEAGTFADDAPAETGDDCVYPVTIMKAGWGGGQVSGANGLRHYYGPEFVAQVAEAVNGAKFGRRHPKGAGFGEDDPDRIAGWYSDGQIAGTEARARLNLLKSETDLRSKLSSARESKKLDMFGLSILATVGFEPSVREGQKCLEARKLGKLYSVDLCSEAGAGGKFLQEMRVAASADQSASIAAMQDAAMRQGSPVHPVRPNGGDVDRPAGDPMNKLLIMRAIEALRSRNATSAAAFQTELNAASEDKYEGIMTRVTEALAATGAGESDMAVREAANAAAASALAEAQRIQFHNVMESALTESRLPEPAKKLVRRRFEGVAGTKEQLDAEIVSVREAFAQTSNSGRVTGIVIPGLDSADKTQLAMDRMLGVREAATSGVAAFRGIRQAYEFVTGDRDLRGLQGGRGGFFARASEAVATTDFPNLLLNSMTKRLMQDWADIGMAGLDQLFDPANVDNYLLQDRVRDGYFDELPVVNEGGVYTEITKPTDERVNYAVQNFGNLLTISEQTIRNDNLGAIARFPGRLARAGMKTLKRYITNFFVSNPTYQADNVAWFSNTHNNLGSAALSYDALVTAEIALFTQTEKDSGEQLGLTLDWLMIPIQLKAQAIAINQTDTAGSNGFFHRFGPNNERIIVNEMMTDDNDWCYGTNKANAPILEIGFLDGIQQPQIFLANNPVVGTEFTNDQLQYKVKHTFGGVITDYRGAGKNVVAG